MATDGSVGKTAAFINSSWVGVEGGIGRMQVRRIRGTLEEFDTYEKLVYTSGRGVVHIYSLSKRKRVPSIRIL